MKKLFSIFALSALVFMYSCKQETGVSQEEFDKLSKDVVEKDTQIAQLQDELEMMLFDLELCEFEKDSLFNLVPGNKPKTTRPKPTNTTTTTTKPDGQQGRNEPADQKGREEGPKTVTDQKQRN
jgi:hypothetical protein